MWLSLEEPRRLEILSRAAVELADEAVSRFLVGLNPVELAKEDVFIRLLDAMADTYSNDFVVPSFGGASEFVRRVLERRGVKGEGEKARLLMARVGMARVVFAARMCVWVVEKGVTEPSDWEMSLLAFRKVCALLSLALAVC